MSRFFVPAIVSRLSAHLGEDRCTDRYALVSRTFILRKQRNSPLNTKLSTNNLLLLIQTRIDHISVAKGGAHLFGYYYSVMYGTVHYLRRI